MNNNNNVTHVHWLMQSVTLTNETFFSKVFPFVSLFFEVECSVPVCLAVCHFHCNNNPYKAFI